MRTPLDEVIARLNKLERWRERQETLEPMSAIAARLWHTMAQVIPNNTWADVAFNYTVYDSNLMLSYVSSTTLTGTVSKTSGSAAIVGVGTSFTTQLRVGQMISVPGTANEIRTVTVITDNTHLTADGNFAYTASGQTAVTVVTRLVCKAAGVYQIISRIAFTATTSGLFGMMIQWNGAAIAYDELPFSLTSGAILKCSTQFRLAVNDYLMVLAYQNTGAGYSTNSFNPYFPEFSIARVG